MSAQPCTICADPEPSHVHNQGERIEDYFTVGRGETAMDAATRWKRRALLAERVCVLYGWSPIGDRDSDRARATSELWREWLAGYEKEGRSVLPADQPGLSDGRVEELANQYADRRAATLALIDQIVVTE